jgi:hypothetical protein
LILRIGPVQVCACAGAATTPARMNAAAPNVAFEQSIGVLPDCCGSLAIIVARLQERIGDDD